MFRFKAIFAFVGSFCRFKILGRVFDHNRDTIGLFSLTPLCGKLRCVWQWIIQFSPAELQSIHRRLFTGVFDHAGQFRTYNITKNEWVLGGDIVVYSSWESICDTLDYDFSQEKQFS